MKKPNLTTYQLETVDPLTVSFLADGYPVCDARIENGIEWLYSLRQTPDGIIAELSPAPWNRTFDIFERGDFFYDDYRDVWQRLDGDNALNTRSGETRQWCNTENTAGPAPIPAFPNYWAEITPILRRVVADTRTYEFGVGGINQHDDAYYAATGQQTEPTGQYRIVVMTVASCGCAIPRRQLMSASLGTSCPDCYDRMSD